MTAPADAHEWVSFSDPDEDRTWVLDVTFLTSPWKCIFGEGCQGVLTELAPELEEGCCSYGAHLADKKDTRRVQRAAKQLTPDQFQNYERAQRVGVIKTEGDETKTRLVGGACIFLNRPDFPGGSGCALHRAALETGVSPLSLKPEVCWQLPLRREDQQDDDTGHVTSTLAQWDRRHWGEAGEEFAWWCTEAPEAFVSPTPVYVSLADELREMIGASVYQTVAAYLDEREQAGTLLPHPVVRRAQPAPSSSVSSRSTDS